MAPSVGVKDYPVMLMYSNLRIDSCGNNHLFLPARDRELGSLVTRPETWHSFGHDFSGGRSYWAWNTHWLFNEVARRERSAWDPVTFGEVIASPARDSGAAYGDVVLRSSCCSSSRRSREESQTSSCRLSAR